MKKSILKLIFTVVSGMIYCRLFSQDYDLSGTWEGGLGQDDKAWVFDMTFNLKQTGNTITGTAKYVANDGHGAYVIQNITGTVEGTHLDLNDLTVKEENNLGGSWYWCKKIYFGRIRISKDSMVLQGDWKNETNKIFHNKELLTNTGVNCPPGTFRVARKFTAQQENIPAPPPPPLPPHKSGIFLGTTISIKKTIAVAGDSVSLSFYDNGDIDNDTISVYYNRVLLLNHQRLTDKPLIVKVPIRKDRDNELLMFAENEGEIPPNTALLLFYDNGNRQEIRLDSNTKETGGIIFRKEK